MTWQGGLGVELGAARLRGTPGTEWSAEGSQLRRPWGGPLAQAGARVTPVGRLAVSLTVEVGWTLLPLRARWQKTIPSSCRVPGRSVVGNRSQHKNTEGRWKWCRAGVISANVHVQSSMLVRISESAEKSRPLAQNAVPSVAAEGARRCQAVTTSSRPARLWKQLG